MRSMDIDPQAVIDALSRQIGALQTENTILKMALQQATTDAVQVHGASPLPADDTKKDAPADDGDAESAD